MLLLLVPSFLGEAYAEFEDIIAPYTIIDDEFGGVVSGCGSIGTWDYATKTCTLTGNISVVSTNHGVEIGSDGITLDGAGYTISGGVRDENCMMSSTTNCGTKHWMMGNAGVFLENKSNVVIKNLTINGFYHGILSIGNPYPGPTITGNTISSPGSYPHGAAIDLVAGYSSKITDNVITNSYTGIFPYNGRGNNQCTGSSAYLIEGNTISGTNIGIKNDWNVVGNDDTVGICFNNNTISGASEYGIEHYTSKGGITTNNTISNSGIGIHLRNSQLLTMTDNSVINSNKGIVADSSSSVLTFSDNTVTGNGVDFEGISQSAVIPEGTVTISSPLNIYAYNPPGTPSPTGGDCTQIGMWDASTKTCTLTADVVTSAYVGAIKIGQAIWEGSTYDSYIGEGSTEGITIDGDGHKLTGADAGGMSDAGVYLYKTHFSTVKDLIIEDFKVGLTPLLTSLTILNYVDIETEQEMLGYGIGIIMLNIGMYFVAPGIVIMALKKRLVMLAK